jgi:hypothetical protein
VGTLACAMRSPNAYRLRRATPEDEEALRRLAEIDRQEPLTGPVLIGELDGTPAAAISLLDSRVIADPCRPIAYLLPLLGNWVRALRAQGAPA